MVLFSVPRGSHVASVSPERSDSFSVEFVIGPYVLGLFGTQRPIADLLGQLGQQLLLVFFMDVDFIKMHNPTNAAPAFRGKSHLGDYSDSPMEMDADIGRIMYEIRADAPDTIVILTADNGAWEAGQGARLMMIVLHDDAGREYAYGPAEGLPDTKVGTFTQRLYDEAKSKGWTVVSMKKDWKRILLSIRNETASKSAAPWMRSSSTHRFISAEEES
jgi:hypothetical protein